MKKTYIFILTFFLAINCLFAQNRAKYIFLFIGDGMGTNQRLAGE